MNEQIAQLEIEQRGEVVVATVRGELDLSVAPEIGEAIGEAVATDVRGLVVDFSGLDFIDSSGVAMLFGLVRRLESRRQEMHVVAPEGRPVHRVLELVDFGRAARLHGDLASALAEPGAPASG